MKSIKNWVINKLGGFTSDQVEETRARCEEWAVDNLTVKEHSVPVYCSIYNPPLYCKITIIKSNVCISGVAVKSVSIAPWCRNVSICGVQRVDD